MSLNDFDELSIAQFQCVIESYRKQDEQREIADLHRARLQAYWMLLPHIDPNKKLKLSDLIELPGDNVTHSPSELMSQEEMRNRITVLKSKQNNEQ